jgi:cysteine-rich repeat protein
MHHSQLRLCAAIAGSATMLVGGCMLEKIDRLIDAHGITHVSSTSDSSETTHAPESTTGSSSSSSSSSSSTDETTLTAESMSSDVDTSSSTGGTSTTETTSQTPVCGDGIIEADETCDDMNDDPDDGCKACARDSTIFISSSLYKGYDLDGLDGADQRCRMLAAIADLPRFATYRAWLSTATTPAADRLIHSPGRYVLINGLVVAQDWDALTSESQPLENPIVVDELSQTQEYRAWTGTLATGQPALGSEFCNDWSDPSGSPWGGNGRSSVTDATWSYFEDGPCGLDLHIYCIEQWEPEP